MNHAKVTLTVIQGKLKRKEFVLEERIPYLLGRSRDCDIVFPLDESTADVSRCHCMLELDPPTISIRDLGSLNGTFVNGKKLGQRLNDRLAGATDFSEPAFQELKDGDEVRIGNTVLRVGVVPEEEPSESLAVPLFFV